MNKYGIVFLILVVVGLGYWFSVSNNSDSLKVSYTKTEQSVTDNGSLNQTPENKIDESIGEVKDQTIINKEDNKKIMQATLHTNKGDITIEFNSATPKTVDNFIKLAKEGFYDGTKFHRVIKDFMSQGGDPLSKDDSKKQYWGTGGPGYKFDDEPFEGEYTRGTVAMANSGPNTNGSQFFIMHEATALPKNYVIFGFVKEGLDVVDKIAEAPVKTSGPGEESKPLQPVKIIEAIVTEE